MTIRTIISSFASARFPRVGVLSIGFFVGVSMLVGVYLARHMSWRPRIFACATAVVLSLIVAFSRMTLGVHFLTDVLAAITGAIAWVALVWSGMNWTKSAAL